jgi:small subunit ribosomal protein S4
VNGRRVDIPNYQTKVGDEVGLDEHSQKNGFVQAAVESSKGRGTPEWLSLNAESLKGTVIRKPQRSDITFPVEEQLIVELYSK